MSLNDAHAFAFSLATTLMAAIIATQAGDGTLSDANRAQIATSLDSVIDDLLALLRSQR